MHVGTWMKPKISCSFSSFVSLLSRKWRFFKNPMNMVDVLAIIPFYLSIFLNQLEDIQIIGKAGKIVRLIRVMRILRYYYNHVLLTDVKFFPII